MQRKKIAEWARLHEVEVVQWWEEIDQSGAKLRRPMFQQALERCERGETGGLVAARLDRFARSAVDALESIKRINQAGARLVLVEDKSIAAACQNPLPSRRFRGRECFRSVSRPAGHRATTAGVAALDPYLLLMHS